MNSTELNENMMEIGKLYEMNRGFIPCREKIGVNSCSYCSLDYKEWYLNDYSLRSGNYEDDHGTTQPSLCSDHFTGICTSFRYEIEQKCLKTVDEFEKIYLKESDWYCRNPIYVSYALFIKLD